MTSTQAPQCATYAVIVDVGGSPCQTRWGLVYAVCTPAGAILDLGWARFGCHSSSTMFFEATAVVLALQSAVGVLPPSAIIFGMCDSQKAAIKLAHRVLTHKPGNLMDRVVAGLVHIDTSGLVLIAWPPAEHDTHSQTVLAQVDTFVDARAKQAVTHPGVPIWTWPSVWCDVDTKVWYKGRAPVMNVKAACKKLPNSPVPPLLH